MLRARGLLYDLSPEEQSVYFEQRLRNIGEDQFKEALAMSGTTTEILPGDEIPAGWLEEQEPIKEGSTSVA
jgi:hypothetical protein